MEVLLPYLVQIGAGSFGAVLICLVFRQINIGIIGNMLAGTMGGLGSQLILKYLLLFFPNSLLTHGANAFVCGAGFMLVIGLLRKYLPQTGLPESNGQTHPADRRI